MRKFFTNTIQFSIKRNSFRENIKDKRTTFLELFFDLAIVFVFALLAHNFSTFMGVSPYTLEGEPSSEVVEFQSIGLISWIVNFIILWSTWFRFGSFFRRFGRDSFISHVVTLLLIISISFQALSQGIDSEWLREYGTLLSILLTSGTFMIGTWANYFLIRMDKRKKITISKAINETIIFSVTLILFLIYMLLDNLDIINVVRTSDGNDYWQYSVGLIVIFSIYLSINLFDLIYNYNQQNKIYPEYEGVIFDHNIERHHLLIIISSGESIIFNVGNATELYHYFSLLIINIIINICIIMLLWYSYKIFVYKPKYKKSTFNLFLYIFLHVLLVAGMLIMASSLKVFAEGKNELINHQNLLNNPTPGTNIPELKETISSLEMAVTKWYPTIYLSGFLIFSLSLVTFIMIAKYKETHIYTKAIIKNRKFIFISSIFFYSAITIMLVLLSLDFDIEMTYVMLFVLLSILARACITGISTHKSIIDESKNMHEAAKHIEELRK